MQKHSASLIFKHQYWQDVHKYFYFPLLFRHLWTSTDLVIYKIPWQFIPGQFICGWFDTPKFNTADTTQADTTQADSSHYWYNTTQIRHRQIQHRLIHHISNSTQYSTHFYVSSYVIQVYFFWGGGGIYVPGPLSLKNFVLFLFLWEWNL